MKEVKSMSEAEGFLKFAAELLGLLAILLVAFRYHVHLLEKVLEKHEKARENESCHAIC